jgi:tight adherence protein B
VAGDLVTLFQDKARDLGSQLVISAAIPAGAPAGSASVVATVRTREQLLTGLAEALIPAVPGGTADSRAGPLPTAVGAGPLDDPLVAVIACLLLFGGLATVLGMGFTALGGALSDGSMRRRLSVYTLTGRQVSPPPTSTLGQHAVARSAVQLVDRVVVKGGFEEKLRRRLDAGGIRLTPAEWILVHGGIAILVAAFLFLLTGGSLLRAAVGLLFGLLVPYAYLTSQDTRRKRRFLEQLPDTLQLLAGSLEAGYSLVQAVDAVSRETQDPMSTEFNRAIVEARLGVPIDDALDSVAERMQCRDFSWVVMAIRIHREVGGNLAEILKTVAGTLRERDRLRREVRVLSAEGRLSGWILGGLPVAFAGYLLLVRPDYLSRMITTVPGLLLAALAILLMILGALWMRRIVDVEV